MTRFLAQIRNHHLPIEEWIRYMITYKLHLQINCWLEIFISLTKQFSTKKIMKVDSPFPWRMNSHLKSSNLTVCNMFLLCHYPFFGYLYIPTTNDVEQKFQASKQRGVERGFIYHLIKLRGIDTSLRCLPHYTSLDKGVH